MLDRSHPSGAVCTDRAIARPSAAAVVVLWRSARDGWLLSDEFFSIENAVVSGL